MGNPLSELEAKYGEELLKPHADEALLARLERGIRTLRGGGCFMCCVAAACLVITIQHVWHVTNINNAPCAAYSWWSGSMGCKCKPAMGLAQLHVAPVAAQCEASTYPYGIRGPHFVC